MAAEIPVIFSGRTASAVRATRQLREQMALTNREARHAGTHFRGASQEVNRFGRGALAGSGAVRHLGRSLAFASATFLGAAGFISVVKDSIGAARDLQIQTARSQIVFGQSSKAIQAWSETTGRALSLARTDALTTANQFGTMLTAMQVAPGVAARLAQQMVKVAAAASLARGESDPAAAVRAITVGLAGRGRALRQYGIIIDDTNLKAEALRIGLVRANVDLAKVRDTQLALSIAQVRAKEALDKYGRSSTQYASAVLSVNKAHESLQKQLAGSQVKLTNQQKAQAAASLVIHQGGRFVRDYGKLMDTAAGQQRQFHAETADLEEELGKGLLPAFTRALRVINPYLRSIETGGKRHAAFVRTLRQVGSVARGIWGVLVTLARGFGRVVDAIGGARTAMILFLAVVAVNKVRRVASSMISMWSEAGRSAARSAALQRGYSVATADTYIASTGEMRLATIGLAATIRGALISTGIGALVVAVGFAAAYTITHWNKVKGWFLAFASFMRRHGVLIATLLLGPIGGAAAYVILHWRRVKEFFSGLAAWFRTLFTHPIRAIRQGFEGLADAIKRVFRGVLRWIGNALSKIPGWLPGVGKFHAWGVKIKKWAGEDGAAAGRAYGTAFGRGVDQTMPAGAIGPVGSGGQPLSSNAPRSWQRGGAHRRGAAKTEAGRAQQSGLGGVSVSGGANRAGVGIKPHVIAFVRRIAFIVGRPLTITTGTNHNEFVIGTNRQSLHWTGNAADIAASGQWLTELGQAALMAAGASASWARQQSGNFYHVGGVEVGFNTMIGGNHFNHLHVGLTSLPPGFNAGTGGTTTVAPPTTTGGGPTPTHTGTTPRHPRPHRPSRESAAGIERETITVQREMRDVRQAFRRHFLTRSQEMAYLHALQALIRALHKPHLTTQQFAHIVNQYRRLWDQINRAVKRGADRAKREAERIAAAHKKAIDDAEKAADLARGKFEDAWGRMADRILGAFDRVTAAGEQAISDQYAALTPAERALQALEARRQQQTIGGAITEAQTKLQRAKEIGDPAMIKEAMDELQSAQDDALAAQLQSQADIERTAADKARDKALREYDDMREIQRQKLQDMLDDLEKKLETGQITWKNALAQIKKLIGANIGDFAALGAAIGSNFLQALLDSITTAGGAQGPLAQALAKLKKLGYRWNPDTGEWEPIPKPKVGPKPPPSTCFVAGTLISTPDGQRAIQELVPGDDVLSWDFDKGKLVTARVAAVMRHERPREQNEVVEVRAAGVSLIGTIDHPVWDGSNWVPLAWAATLWRPDSGSAAGTQMRSKPRQPTYNLHISHPDHNYVANGFLVHNKVVTQMQEGGIYTGRKPLQALLHGPEAVIPLGDRRARSLLSGGGDTYHIQVVLPRYLGDARTAAKEIRTELLKIQKQNPRSIWQT